jgi:hypothetical protein
MARVLVGVQGNSTRSLSASFLAVPGVYARQRLGLRPNSGDRRRWGVGEKVGEVCELTKGPSMAGVGAEGQQAAAAVVASAPAR